MSTYSNSKTGALWQYDYYPTGERYGKTDLVQNRGEMYVSRFGDVVAEYDRTGSDSNIDIALKNTFVQGLGIDSKSMRVTAGQVRRHYLTDQVGTVGMTLDDTGGVVDTSVKDAWGQQIAGGTSERYGGIAQREIDTESGLIYMRQRMYDPRLGRFTQTDPLRGNRAFEHYAYAGNNPINRTDPMGDRWKFKGGVGSAEMIKDLQKYTGRKITVDGSGTALFAASTSGEQYASKGDMDWIWRVQNDDSETDIAGLWRYLTNGDEWHRKKFSEAWADNSGQQTWWQAFDQGGMAGLHGFAQGATFGGYQAPQWAKEMPGFEISKGIGTATALVEAGLTGAGAGAGFTTSVAKVGTMALEGAASLLPGATATATGAAASPQGQQAIQRASRLATPEAVPPQLRARILEVADHVLKFGRSPAGVRQGNAAGGSIGEFMNRGRLLPEMQKYYYTESDLWSSVSRAARGIERVVVGLLGDVYYSPDHYQTFIRIR
jgi:RHS repeat-associated protein